MGHLRRMWRSRSGRAVILGWVVALTVAVLLALVVWPQEGWL